jgi:hypothetical protein
MTNTSKDAFHLLKNEKNFKISTRHSEAQQTLDYSANLPKKTETP